MHIINLTMDQFKNYAKIHTSRNFGQTIEYARLESNNNKSKYFLGFVDDNNIIHAACLVLIININTFVKEAICKDGFLIDYANFYLVSDFIKELKIYLKKLKVTYLKVDPVFKYKVYNKKNDLIENNENLLDNFIRLDFKNNDYPSEFAKYDVIIENYNTSNDIYNHFNRNTKRNINDCKKMGITLHKGTKEDIEIFYSMIKKKKNNSIKYYEELINAYNTNDNKMEIFFTKLNIHKFLERSKELYDKEIIKHDKLTTKFLNNSNKMKDKLYNRKIEEDALLNKRHEQLELANSLKNLKEEDIYIGTTAVIKNNQEIYFLIDGYNDKYRQIHSSHLLKWAIIKKYSDLGYHKFNLGEIHDTFYNKNGKYRGHYLYKIGFGGNIVEYPPEMILPINKTIYNTFLNKNKLDINL